MTNKTMAGGPASPVTRSMQTKPGLLRQPLERPQAAGQQAWVRMQTPGLHPGANVG